MPQQPDKEDKDLSESIERLKESSKQLKDRIDEEKRRHDLPLDSHLGDPNWEERAKDGHLDLPPEDE